MIWKRLVHTVAVQGRCDGDPDGYRDKKLLPVSLINKIQAASSWTFSTPGKITKSSFRSFRINSDHS